MPHPSILVELIFNGNHWEYCNYPTARIHNNYYQTALNGSIIPENYKYGMVIASY